MADVYTSPVDPLFLYVSPSFPFRILVQVPRLLTRSHSMHHGFIDHNYWSWQGTNHTRLTDLGANPGYTTEIMPIEYADVPPNSFQNLLTGASVDG